MASIHGNLQDGGESGSRKKLIGQFRLFTSTLNQWLRVVRAVSKKHVEHVKPSNTAPSTF